MRDQNQQRCEKPNSVEIDWRATGHQHVSSGYAARTPSRTRAVCSIINRGKQATKSTLKPSKIQRGLQLGGPANAKNAKSEPDLALFNLRYWARYTHKLARCD